MRGTLRRSAFGVVAAASVVATWGDVYGARPTTGLDPSWKAALAMASRAHFRWGRDIVFTYGPLGYLNNAQLWTTRTAVLALLYKVGVHLAFAATLLVLGRRVVGAVGAVGVAFVGLAIAKTMEPADLITVVAMLVAVAAVNHRGDERAVRWVVPALSALSAVQLYVKLNSGLTCLAMTLLAAWVIGPGRLRGLVRGGVVFVAVLGALGLVLIGPASAIATYFVRSWWVAAGYSSAGALEDHALRWQYPTVVAIAALVAAILWRRPRGSPRVITAAIVAVAAYFAFKHSFVRHDIGHGPDVFVTAAMLSLALPAAGRTRVLAAVVALASVAAVVGNFAHVSPVRLLFDPRPAATLARNHVSDILVPGRRAHVVAESRTAMAASLGVDALPLAELRRGTVDVGPNETSVAWVTGLRWRPVPMFQTYTAYTADLDDLDAARLRSPRAPDRLLRFRPAQSIDLHNPPWESPAQALTMLCRYRLSAQGPDWLVLSRATDRCGRPRPLGRRRLGRRQVVTVPQAGPDEIVYARLHLPRSVFSSAWGVLFKPKWPLAEVDGYRYRLVPELSRQPLLMHVPPATGFSPTVAWFDFRHLALIGVRGRPEIEFYAVGVGA